MNKTSVSRRQFLRTGKNLALGTMTGSLGLHSLSCASEGPRPAVSFAKIRNDNIDEAVTKAIDLLGGMETLTRRKEKILIKPNLVNATPTDTTHPEVVKALANLMQRAGKEVLLGEASAGAEGFNISGGEVRRTRKTEILDPMQQYVFDELEYTKLAKSLDIPLINLHSGDMVEVTVPEAFVFDRITLHRCLTEVDLICSVPMMKTHRLTKVTLGMKNLFGLYPGTTYHSVRGPVHERTSLIEPSGTAPAIIDMVRATKVGLVVIDASTAMEGQGPSVSFGGKLVRMNLIIAGTNPLATDMVAAHIMGFDPEEIPTFAWAHRAGMKPKSLEDIDIRAEETVVRQAFLKPQTVSWMDIRESFGAREI